MGMQTVGDKLRQARVRKGLQVSEIEKQIGIESHFLLAMELDQFRLLPVEMISHYISSFATVVDLNPQELLAQYEQELTGNTTDTYDYTNNSDVETSNLFSESIRGSRLNRRKKHKSFSFIRYVMLIGLLLLVLLGSYYVYPKVTSYFLTSDTKQVSTSGPEAKKSVKTKVEQPVEQLPQTRIRVEGAGNQLSAKISTSQTPITVSFALDGADSSWIALTNSELGELGTLLTLDNPNYETTLTEETSTALLSLGVSKGVTVKINEELLDIADLVTGDVTTVNLEFQLESR